MSQYLPIIALLVLSVLFGAISLVMSHLLAPRRPSAARAKSSCCSISRRAWATAITGRARRTRRGA